MHKIMECVPNFSEGRDKGIIEKIAAAFRHRDGVKLLDCSSDADHHRSVITVAGEPGALKEAVVEAMGTAVALIDLTQHRGQHPRMGAVDVVPFVPISNVTMEEAISLSKEVAAAAAARYALPVYLYERSATAPHRENLSTVRRGGFEALSAKMTLPDWIPDYGPSRPHPTAGAAAVGARPPLVAYNVNLATDNLQIAIAISRRVRHLNGGLRYCKAMGVALRERGITQVSMNLTDCSQTALYRAHELVRIEAQRYGVAIAGAEVIGLLPLETLVETAAYYLGLENFSVSRVLEARLAE
ncbi:MAG: glutamate formimidoyltransferase [Proteiniphilum sp.]|jgi:glutamate formiminotransferase|nr:glutamate formimidoyltransferase [Proteiniphilum sp.]